MPKEKLSREDWQKKREAMLKEPGTFVNRGLSLESRSILTRMNEYDFFVNTIKKRVGRPGNDQQKLMSLIEQCVAFEENFKGLLSELKTFVSTLKGEGKMVAAGSNGNGNGNNSAEKV